MTETQLATGKISKISVGIIVPNGLSFEQINNIETVLNTGLGIDKSRGDSLVVVSSLVSSKIQNPTVIDQKELKSVDSTIEEFSVNNLYVFFLILIFLLIALVAWLTIKTKNKTKYEHKQQYDKDRIMINLQYWLNKND